MVNLPSLFHASSNHTKSDKTHSHSGRTSRTSSILSINESVIEEGKNWFMKQLHIPHNNDKAGSRGSSRRSSAETPNLLTPISTNNMPSTITNHSSMDGSSMPIAPKSSIGSLRDYGEYYKKLGKGSTAVISVFRMKRASLNSKDNGKLFVVKQFRKRIKSETEKAYMKKLVSEFCISSTFHHINIVETIDLVMDDQNRYCTVMEYCPGGDLFSAIMSGHMTPTEMSCCFKQLMNGLAYLHSVGVAHRDIKPENLLMTLEGGLKITDFGVSDVFRCAWETQRHKSHGLVGSEPYIAPEAFQSKEHEYWGSNADIWSAGIVLYSIYCSGHAWVRADIKADRDYWNYVQKYSTRSYQNFERFPPFMRNLVYRMLDPNPETRITADEVLDQEWVKSVSICHHNVDSSGKVHHHCITAK